MANTNQSLPIRQPAVAGQFYPTNKDELEAMIDNYLNEASPPETQDNIMGLMVPHAGYVYSGPVAAYGYKKLIGQDIETVIIIGNSHQEYFDGISVYPEGYFRTPLGDIEVDSSLAKKLIGSNNKIFYKESTHVQEHSIEVQLPFLQKVLKNFKIVPILMGSESTELSKILSDALKNNIDSKTLIIASSDMSHYPSYEDSNYADNKVIEAILTGKVENLEKTLSDLSKENIANAVTFLCAEGSVKTLMLLASEIGANNINLLKHANSGDTAGDKSQVVGYSAISFSSTNQISNVNQISSAVQETSELNKEEQEDLLKIARQTVEGYVNDGKVPQFTNTYPALEKHLGAFVTLKENGNLRGCIGRFQPNLPLYQVVSQMALAAATQDTRFNPVSKDELDKLDYEISVLSPLIKVNSWQDVEIGKQGVEIKNGLYSGVFLPQVATENNWDLETFLSILCTEKVGLKSDCYKDPQSELYVFTAQVFGEKE